MSGRAKFSTLHPKKWGCRLRRAREPSQARHLLADLTHKWDGPKARGFERILGITIADIDYLEGAICTGVLLVPVRSVEENPPHGISCVVSMPVHGRGEKTHRVVDVTTAWLLGDADIPPRLVSSSYIKP